MTNGACVSRPTTGLAGCLRPGYVVADVEENVASVCPAGLSRSGVSIGFFA